MKGNQKLSLRETEALIDELLQLENPYNCPHGRPTIISMTKYELEKKFKRIGVGEQSEETFDYITGPTAVGKQAFPLHWQKR